MRMDEPLRALLEAGDIRLIRCKWLLSPEADAALGRDHAGHVVMLPMQKLLKRAPEAFFSPAEAAELLNEGNRAIFALSHGWQTQNNPDPHGWTLSAVRHFLRGPWESPSVIEPAIEERWH